MITIKTIVNASMEKVWDNFTNPYHIVNWNTASKDWHCTRAINNLEVGEKFNYEMASNDGKISFEFEGEYTEIITNKIIRYILADNRKVDINFKQTANGIEINEMFDPEKENSEELQQEGWQNILNNFKNYTEQK